MRRLGRAAMVVAFLCVCAWALRDMEALHARSARGPAALAPPTRRDRVLVLAPHCDDEVVACGGLLQQAVKAGAQVQVVVITNGDGFRAAAEKLTGDEAPTRQDFLRLAEQRQKETRAGLKVLGVSPGQVTFLGYPDAGTASLWMKNWTTRDLYKSSHTQEDHSPYADSFRRHAPYCGRALLDDLEAVMRRFRPTVVALPHAADTHPDHWAAYCYGTAALYELDSLSKVRRLHYVVHERGWTGDPEAGPVAAFGTWRALRLTDREQVRKRQAIACHGSQLAVMKSYLLGFAQPAEPYTDLEPEQLPRRARGTLRIDGATEDWRGVPVALADPAERGVPAGANVTSVRACQDGQDLYLLIELKGEAMPDLACDVHLHYLVRGRVEGPTNYRVDLRHPVSRLAWRAEGRFFEIAVPVPPRDWEGAILSVDTVRDHKLVDRTRSVMLLLGTRH